MVRTAGEVFASLLLAACVATLSARAGPPEPGEGYHYAGTIRPRHARDIESSPWSVGAETMGREYTIYRHWRAYLGPLGVQRARIQSGWARTEQARGEYDWDWLDEIIPDMARQGVEPWVCLCYGNPVYEGGGGVGLGDELPTSEEALAAWESFVAAFVERYGEYVDEWEIWNEPGLGREGMADQYASFLVRTAEVIREKQPEATIIGISAAGTDVDLVDGVLGYLEERDKLHLLDEVTYHPYSFNPDAVYDRVAALRRTIHEYSERITIRQGENGAPSRRGSFGALSDHDWTERRQAKWALRRLMGDRGRDIPSSYFAICDMHYPARKNYKGLLATNPDQTVHHAKLAYRAVQHVTAIFDGTLTRIDDYEADVSGGSGRFSVFGYRSSDGEHVATLWRDSAAPGVNPKVERVTLTIPGERLEEPVWVDMLSGEVYDIGSALRGQDNGAVTLRQVHVHDSVILVAEKDAIPLRSGRRAGEQVSKLHSRRQAALERRGSR